MSLLVVRGDSLRTRVRRRGRFAVPRDLAASPRHMETAVKEHLNLMVHGLARRGYEYGGGAVEVRGPLPHYEFSDDATPDKGPEAAPDPRDLKATEAFARAERARTARKAGEDVPLDDYELVTTFERRLPGALEALPCSLSGKRSPGNNPPP